MMSLWCSVTPSLPVTGSHTFSLQMVYRSPNSMLVFVHRCVCMTSVDMLLLCCVYQSIGRYVFLFSVILCLYSSVAY